MKKKMSLALAILLLIMVPIQAMAVSGGFTDMPNDWSTKAFSEAIDNGLIKGYEGKVFPKKNLTRAEMAAIMNRALKSETGASLNGYVDVTPGTWQYEEMSKAVGSKIFQGSNGRLYPNNMITREEAFVVLSRVLDIKSGAQNKMAFYDLGSISDWAREEINGMLNAGYVNGSKGFINPKAPITRAEFVQLMSNVIKTYIDDPGTYKNVEEGNVVVNTPGVTLKDITIKGDLIIADGVGEGEVTLDDVDVTGRLLVRAGGENSIIIKGSSTVGSVIVTKLGKTARIFNNTKKEIKNLEVKGESDVILEGSFDRVDVVSNMVKVIFRGAKVRDIRVIGSEGILDIDDDSEIDEIVIDAPKVLVEGKGTVEKVIVGSNGDESEIKTPNTEISVDRKADDVVGSGSEKLDSGEDYKNGTSSRADAKPVDEADEREERPTRVYHRVYYVVVGTGGVVTTTVDSGDDVIKGRNLVFEVKPSEGYQLKEIKVNDEVLKIIDNTFTLEILRNTDITATFELKPVVEEKFDLRIETDPAASTVVLRDAEGTILESVEGTFTLEAGSYTYTVSKEGYVTKTDTVVLSKDTTTTVTLALEAVEEPTLPTVVSIASPAAIEMEEGETLPTLPTKVSVTLSDETVVDLDVVWDTATFENVVGTHEIFGTITLIAEDMENPDGIKAVQVVNISEGAIESTAPVATVEVGNISILKVTFDQPVFIGDVPLENVSTVMPKLDLLQLLFADSTIDATAFNEVNIVVNSTSTELTIEMNDDAINGDLFYALDHPDGGYTGNGDGIYRKDVTIDLSVFNNSEDMPSETVFEPFKIKFYVPVENGVTMYGYAIAGIFQTQAQRDEEIDPVADTTAPSLAMVEPSYPRVISLEADESFSMEFYAVDDNLDFIQLMIPKLYDVPFYIRFQAEEDPYYSPEVKQAMEDAEITASYDMYGKWTITFGPNIIGALSGGATTKIDVVIVDYAGNAYVSAETGGTIFYDITQLDRSGLNALVNAIDLMNETDYTISSWSDLVTAMNELPESTQTEIDEKIDQLEALKNALIFRGSDSYITKDGDLVEDKGVYSATFHWGSVNGVGSLEETISGSYGYYTDGAYLRFQVENTTGAAVSFAEVFETLDDGNNSTGGMTLQTNGGNINDMDGSNREKADWGIAGFEGFKTNLPGVNSLYYGVIQNATVGTKTVGFGSGEARVIDMTLTPRADLLPGTYTLIVDVMQQNGSTLGDPMIYTFTIPEDK